MDRLQELLDFLAANVGSLTREELDDIFTEAMGLLDALPEGSTEAQSWYNRFSDYFDAEPADADAPDEEPEVEGKEEQDPADPEEEAQVTPPKLPSHQIDVPEEPERVHVKTMIFNPATGGYEEKDLGQLLLIPTGCEEPEFFSPYENAVSFRSPLPRDKEREANLYALYQQNGWASRNWIRKNLDEDLSNPEHLDKEIADDIPIILALQGKPDVATGAAQTPGTDGAGDNNGAPLPPGPGPGRGNLAAPGDNAAG